MTRIPEGDKYSAIIVAAGSGSRFGGYKQLLKIGGRNIVEIVLDRFSKCGASELVLVTKKELFPHFEYLRDLFDIPIKIVEGGQRRGDSVFNGVKAAAYDNVLIHDAARPFLSCTLIQRVLGALKKYNAVIPVVPVRDTVVKVKDEMAVSRVDREDLRSVQTPQGFKRNVLLYAFELAREKKLYFTDESTMLIDTLGLFSRIVDGEHSNLKITYREDLEMFRYSMTAMGYDIHRLKEGGLLKVGGVVVKEGISPVAYSDGDVVLHALIDALLAIKGKDDIGTLFPDTDDQWKDADSGELLLKVMEYVGEINILKVDITCILEKIKLSPFKDKIKKSIATYLGIPEENVSFKARTKEGIGEVGKGKAIEAFCLVTYSI